MERILLVLCLVLSFNSFAGQVHDRCPAGTTMVILPNGNMAIDPAFLDDGDFFTNHEIALPFGVLKFEDSGDIFLKMSTPSRDSTPTSWWPFSFRKSSNETYVKLGHILSYQEQNGKFTCIESTPGFGFKEYKDIHPSCRAGGFLPPSFIFRFCLVKTLLFIKFTYEDQEVSSSGNSSIGNYFEY